LDVGEPVPPTAANETGEGGSSAAQIEPWSGEGLDPDELSLTEAMVLFEAGSVSSLDVGSFGFSTSPGAESAVPAQEFWLNINAELIIYGGTVPDASLTVGGRTIELRPDGTFSCRFALPDGTYTLEIKADATSGETRRARLRFARSSEFRDAVGTAPLEPGLEVVPNRG
jgi:hypothetical protein